VWPTVVTLVKTVSTTKTAELIRLVWDVDSTIGLRNHVGLIPAQERTIFGDMPAGRCSHAVSGDAALCYRHCISLLFSPCVFHYENMEFPR